MIKEAKDVDHVKATEDQIHRIAQMRSDKFVESLRDAPVIFDGYKIYMVLEGVAYPVNVLAGMYDDL